MNEPLFFEDLVVGAQWESRGRTVTEADIVNFACQTGDFDPLHVDHEAAKRTPFRRPIAHGLLGLAWAAGSASHWPMVHTEAFVAIRQWEFLKAVFVGDTVRVRNLVVETSRQGRRRGRVVWRREVINQNGEIVQRGFFETLVRSRPARSPRPRPSSDSAAASHSGRKREAKPERAARDGAAE